MGPVEFDYICRLLYGRHYIPQMETALGVPRYRIEILRNLNHKRVPDDVEIDLLQMFCRDRARALQHALDCIKKRDWISLNAAAMVYNSPGDPDPE